MKCLHLYLQTWKKAVVFQGRARRLEYICFGIINAVVIILLAVIDGLIGTYSVDLGVGLLWGLFSVATILPSISVTIRRFHDMNYAGLWFLLSFVPLINIIVMLFLIFAPGSPGHNRFGPDPRT